MLIPAIVLMSTTPMAAMTLLLSSRGVTITRIPLYGPDVAILLIVVPIFRTSSRPAPVYALSMTLPFAILIPS